MYLTSNLRHTVNKAALNCVRKVFDIGSIFIHRIDMEMHMHTVTGTLFYGCRDAHAKDMGILFESAENALFPA